MTAELMGKYRRPGYNCAHYACDVWEHETGQDIRPAFAGFLQGASTRRALPSLRMAFRGIPAPASPCLVLFKRDNTVLHVGVFVRGRVLHLSETGPVRQLLDVARLGFRSVKFYAPRPPGS